MGLGDGGRVALTLLAGLLLSLEPRGALALPQEVLLLRHGHKDIQRGDFNLSPQGLARMETLASVIPACFGAVNRITVYPFDRTTGKNSRSYQSAVPLAATTGVAIALAESAPDQSEQVGRALLDDPATNGARVVMIWEHRRLPDLARGLGWPGMPPIADDDFDRLDRLRYQPGSATPVVERFSQAALLDSPCVRRQLANHQLAARPNPALGLQLDVDALKRRIGPPPAPGSQAADNDLAVLRWLQASRTPLQVASSWILLQRDTNLFNSALGVDLSHSAPQLSHGLKEFLTPIDQAKEQIKNAVRRPRPFVSHPDIRPCLPRESGFSYPSGHSTWYSAAAALLSDLLPSRAERLHNLGQQGGFNRSLCGVHYPSDVEAGHRLGAAAAAAVIRSDAWRRFRQDPGIEAEVRALQAIPAQDLPPMLH